MRRARCGELFDASMLGFGPELRLREDSLLFAFLPSSPECCRLARESGKEQEQEEEGGGDVASHW